MHIHEWLDENEGKLEDPTMKQVWKFLDFKTRSAIHQHVENPDGVKGLSIFCEFQGEKHRVTGASRLGDIWLVTDFSRDTGHNKRVDIDDCDNFEFKQEVV